MAVQLEELPGKEHMARQTHPVQFVEELIAQTSKEFEITWRMLADNALASFTPGLVLVTAVYLRQKLSLWYTAELLCKACILCSFYTYIFDAANQAGGAEEDRVNKPYRPIPAGLLTSDGAMRRFWIVMVLYAVAGWFFGVLKWVLMWQVATVIINVWCPPWHYFWCKTLCMSLGVGAQLSQAWQLVTPIDETGRLWVVFMAVAYPPPLIFEDVRDMAGDMAAGRRTLALMLGDLPIRIWFATILTAMPIMVHLLLFSPASTQLWRVAVCDVSVASIWRTCAVRSLLLRTVAADRVTYQLFILTYIVVLGCACILWA